MLIMFAFFHICCGKQEVDRKRNMDKTTSDRGAFHLRTGACNQWAQMGHSYYITERHRKKCPPIKHERLFYEI
jgi:hypothetical protein